MPATTFLVQQDRKFSIRWFTPEYEIDLCGHGTLAAGYVIFNKINPSLNEVELHSPAGLLHVKRQVEFITLDFPIKEVAPCSIKPSLIQSLGETPREVYQYKNERCLAVFESEEQIKKIKPKMEILKELEYRGVIVTAPSNSVDFVSRVFYPKKLLSEDAVTGSSYCLLVPYWSKRLNKTEFHARQLSHRGGELFCKLVDDRVFISGKAVLYMEGFILMKA